MIARKKKKRMYNASVHMRISLKRLSIYSILCGLIFNVYLFYRLHDDFGYLQLNGYDFEHRQLNSSDFLVLDWTGKQHIFKEKDPIKCIAI